MAKKSDFEKHKHKHPTTATAIDAMYTAIKNAPSQTPEGRFHAAIVQHAVSTLACLNVPAGLSPAQACDVIIEGNHALDEAGPVLKDAILNGITEEH